MANNNLGKKIRDKLFEGNPYAQLAALRKSIYAMYVLQNKDKFTEEVIATAESEIENMLSLNEKVEDLLNG